MKITDISHNVLSDGEIKITLYTSPVEDTSPRLVVIKAGADGMHLEFYENAEKAYGAFCTYEEWFEIAKRII